MVMGDVLNGRVPALQVVHFDDGHWGIADGHHVPSERNLQATHLWHVLEIDDSLAELATLPPGHQADRDALGEPWVIGPLDDRPNPTAIDRIRALIDIVRIGARR